MEKIVGKTKDVGFQIGVRKTFAVSQEVTWNFMFSDEGTLLWLGHLKNILQEKEPYQTAEGIQGKVKVFNPLSHIRLTYQPKEWKNISTLQIRVMGNDQKTTISFHQEKLLDSEQRSQMKAHWEQVLQSIVNQLSA